MPLLERAQGWPKATSPSARMNSCTRSASSLPLRLFKCTPSRCKCQPLIRSISSPLAISVLIVDDDQGIRETLRYIIEEAGYPVLEARDGIEALDMLRRQHVPLVVLTDHRMPRLDGPGLLRSVLDTPAFVSSHAYVYMTAGTRELAPALQELLTALDAVVLFKPLSIDELLSTIAKACHRLCPARCTL